MRAVCYGIFILFSFFLPELLGKLVCSRSFHINCKFLTIVITEVNATATLSEHVLQKCNGNHACQMSVPNGQCLDYRHYCSQENDVLEVGDSPHSTMEAKSLFSLKSANYSKGKMTDAKNINCYIRPLTDNKMIKRTMHVTAIELSPFLNSTDYCFKVSNSDLEPFCSGSEKLNTVYGPFESISGWNFEMKMADTATNIPSIRFWIDIKITSNKDTKYDLKCNSISVYEPTTDEATKTTATTSAQLTGTSSVTKIIVYVLSIVLTITFAAIAIGFGLFCRKRKTHKRKIETGSQRQSCYMAGDPPYIEIGGIDDLEAMLRTKSAENMASSEKIEPMSKPCPNIPGISLKDRKLPLPPRPSNLNTTACQHPLLTLMIQDVIGEMLERVSVQNPETDDEYVPPSIDQEEEDGINDAAAEMNISANKGNGPKKKAIANEEQQDSDYPGISPDDDQTPPIEDQNSHLKAEMAQDVRSTQGVQESENPTDETAEENVYNPLDQESLIPPEERNKPTIYVTLPAILSEEIAVETIEEPEACAENAEGNRKDESVSNENTSSLDQDDSYHLELIADDTEKNDCHDDA